MTTPADTPDEFAGSDLVRLHTAVMRDRPAEMTAQADAWDSLAALLRSHGTALTGHTERFTADWTGATATAYRDYLARRATGLSAAADLAARNGSAWRAIATTARRAQTELAAIHDDWDREGRPGDDRRRDFDDRAREAMTAIAAETDFHKSGFENHGRYAELAPTGFVQQERPEGHLEDDELGGAVMGVPATSAGDGVSAPASQSSAHSPQLQAVAAPSPTPAPVTAAPPATANPAPLPAPHLPNIPPTRATAPTPPSTPPRTAPGSSPARPLAARPTASPAASARRPAPGLGRTAITASGRGTAAAPTRPAPRPPQATVKPVLNTRPGSTGAAPTAATRYPKPLARPVIGSRASAKPNAPKGALIGKDGVVRGGGTVAKARHSRRNRDRDQKPGYRDGARQDFWTPPTTVPGVITAGAGTENAAHDPGTVAPRTEQDEPRPVVSERGVVERLARPVEDAADGDWPNRTVGRGVIRPQARRPMSSDVSIDGLDD